MTRSPSDTPGSFRATSTFAAIESNHRSSSAFSAAPRAYEPSEQDVTQLIERAHEHPLGIDFLNAGSLDAVSAMFSVHAFVVERARVVLHSTGMSTMGGNHEMPIVETRSPDRATPSKKRS